MARFIKQPSISVQKIMKETLSRHPRAILVVILGCLIIVTGALIAAFGNAAPLSAQPDATPASVTSPVYDDSGLTLDDVRDIVFYDSDEDTILSLVSSDWNTIKVVQMKVSGITDEILLDAGGGNHYSLPLSQFDDTVQPGDIVTVYVLLAR